MVLKCLSVKELLLNVGKAKAVGCPGNLTLRFQGMQLVAPSVLDLLRYIWHQGSFANSWAWQHGKTQNKPYCKHMCRVLCTRSQASWRPFGFLTKLSTCVSFDIKQTRRDKIMTSHLWFSYSCYGTQFKKKPTGRSNTALDRSLHHHNFNIDNFTCRTCPASCAMKAS